MANVLIGCEYSAVVRDAFRRRGHNAWSCDLEPCDGDPKWHYQQNVLTIVDQLSWDLAVFHPPCTYLTNAGARWFVHPDDKHLPTEKRRVRSTNSRVGGAARGVVHTPDLTITQLYVSCMFEASLPCKCGRRFTMNCCVFAGYGPRRSTLSVFFFVFSSLSRQTTVQAPSIPRQNVIRRRAADVLSSALKQIYQRHTQHPPRAQQRPFVFTPNSSRNVDCIR